MKAVLIYLPHPWLREPEAQAPLGLLYLGSALQTYKYQVEVKNYSAWSRKEAIKDLPRASFYGITVTSLELLEANRFAKEIKKRYPDAIVGLGGPGVFTPEFIDWDVIDCICKGDGEITIRTIMRDIEKKGLKKVYDGVVVKNLDEIEFPARHLLKGSQGGNIFAYKHNYHEHGSTIVITSRGCGFRCTFCSAPNMTMGEGVRYRSAESVYQEIKHIKEHYNIKQIRFSDDIFTANKKRVLEICDKIGPLDVAWRISCRVKPLDEEMVKAMVNAGCKEVSLGVESFDSHVLNIFKKQTTPRDNVKALEACAKHGMKTRVLFMVRTPGQTKKTIRVNKEYLEKVPYDIICCTIFVPIPGSLVWERPDDYNIEILSRNLDDYNFYFFGAKGENELKDVIKIKNRSLKAFNGETIEFRDYLKSTGKLNMG